MGFIFRTIFWLGLALLILPPEARISRDTAADIRDLDIGLEVHNALYGVWAYGTQLANGCDHNPKLCRAGANLLDQTVEAASELTSDLKDRWQDAADAADKLAEAAPKHPKKIQARVE